MNRIVGQTKYGIQSQKCQYILLIIICSFCLFSFSCHPLIPDEIRKVYGDLPDQVDFNFHIKPILADRCYKCHGPDENTREANFRLDLEEEAFAKLKESGGHAFVKGKINRSKAWARMTSYDPEFQMPPPESNLSLSDEEKALITRWIKQGAKWKKHWAFIPPEEPPIPSINSNDEVTISNPIDNFIRAKLLYQNLSPSTEADRERLLRRLSFDLTGLPPSIAEVDIFLSDTSSDAYADLVDRLLDSDAYAERMTMDWLDVARYADSQGMHGDMERHHWPWRDWVIKAFKQNMKYGNFVSWQIAGDLLPNATQEQKLATAFHRNHPISAEGGIVDEEFRQKYVQDRTNTTATALLGLTMECATCHDHKFDPISQKEYYQMSAFFNNLKEIGMVAEGGGSSGPVMLLPDEDQERNLAKISKELGVVQEKLRLTKEEVMANAEYIKSIQNQKINVPIPYAFYPLESIQPSKEKVKGGYIHRILNNSKIGYIVDNNVRSVASGEPDIVKGRIGNALRLKEEFDLVILKDVGNFEINEPFTAGAWIHIEEEGENQTIMGTSGELGNAWKGWDLFIDTDNRPSIRLTSYWPHDYVQITAKESISKEQWQHVLFTYDGSTKAEGLNLYINGKQANCETIYDNLYKSIVHSWKKQPGWNQKPVMVGRSGRFYTGDNGVFKGSIDHIQLFNRYITPIEVRALFYNDTNDNQIQDNQEAQREEYLDHFLNTAHSEYKVLTGTLQSLLGEKLELVNAIPEIMVMEDMPKSRKTYVLDRGQYNVPLEEVEPGTPEQVLKFNENLPKNRLGLAKWLVSQDNPLTARVAVNRYWQMIFGRGIVETPHDFGTQGALPSHPELLDWLSIKFMESDWDIRALIRLMVMSSTYKQTSIASVEQLEKDANNIFLSRAPSYRLSAEMIRDNALAASGLLAHKTGGPSVKPYQPEGLWVEKTGPSMAYKHHTGDSLYRRSMYTFIRRTTPHPAMTAFDAPNRSVCTVKRENTNTPIQALVLLNDPQFVEAAKVLAQRMQKEGGQNFEEQVRNGFHWLCGRNPKLTEMQLMKKQYDFAIDQFGKDPQAADQLVGVGEYIIDENLDPINTAALAIVASTMMNFDEAYMKR